VELAPSEGPEFELLAVGDDLPSLTRGPIREPHLMRWSAAIENWHRIHYDQQFAVNHDHLPGLLINGSWKQHFLVQMVRDWAEPPGWLRSISFEFRAMDVVGAVLTAWGHITDLVERDGLGWVNLEIGIRNETTSVDSTRGTAIVVLPLRNGAAVPYPFPVSTIARAAVETSISRTDTNARINP
jgi:acyl dehydratase